MLIPTLKNVKTITDMREDAINLLKDVEKNGLAYIFHRSKPKAVLMNIDEFVSLQKDLEDYNDYLDAKRLSGEKRGPGVSLFEIAKKHV